MSVTEREKARIKLAIRNDLEADMVRAFIATIDGVKMFELGSIRVGVLNGRDDLLFRSWQAVMKQAMERAISFVDGLKVESWSGDIDPADLEGKPQG